MFTLSSQHGGLDCGKNLQLSCHCRNALTCVKEALEIKKHKTGAINELGLTHSLASSEHCLHLVLFCKILKDVRTDDMGENNYLYTCRD